MTIPFRIKTDANAESLFSPDVRERFRQTPASTIASPSRFEAFDIAVIAVAVDHGNAARMSELSDWENSEFKPARGEAFFADLVGAVKPAMYALFPPQTSPTSDWVFVTPRLH